jgi:hypothetical protein
MTESDAQSCLDAMLERWPSLGRPDRRAALADDLEALQTLRASASEVHRAIRHIYQTQKNRIPPTMQQIREAVRDLAERGQPNQSERRPAWLVPDGAMHAAARALSALDADAIASVAAWQMNHRHDDSRIPHGLSVLDWHAGACRLVRLHDDERVSASMLHDMAERLVGCGIIDPSAPPTDPRTEAKALLAANAKWVDGYIAFEVKRHAARGDAGEEALTKWLGKNAGRMSEAQRTRAIRWFESERTRIAAEPQRPTVWERAALAREREREQWKREAEECQRAMDDLAAWRAAHGEKVPAAPESSGLQVAPVSDRCSSSTLFPQPGQSSK